MTKWAARYEICEVAKLLDKTEDEVFDDIESGRLATIVRAEILTSDGSEYFDWSLIPPEGVRRILAGTHDIIEWKNYGIKRSCQSKQEQLRILTRDTNAEVFQDAIYWDGIKLPSKEARKVNNSLDCTEEYFSALFDPVTVEALDKMFNVDGGWRKRTERASRNDLISARQGRSMFNPYKAAMWLLNKGTPNFDLAKCHRILSNNLPSRSRDKKHFFVDDIE